MSQSRLTLLAIWPVAAVSLLTACGGDGPSGPPVLPELVLDTVATGMSHPLFVTTSPGDQARLFVVERTGQIRIVKNGTLLATPFLDITAELFSGPEQGILGLAFPPDYASSKYFVVYYVNPDTVTVLSRFHVSSASADTALPGEDTLLSIPQPIFPDHSGGMLAYGRDGYLYLSVGDGGCCGDPDGHGQDRTELLGSILRLDVGASGPYAIPPDNPWASDPTFRHELWNYGLRNPWRFSFDRVTGDLYIADVGNDTREEVSIVSGTSPGGENYGWRIMEGGHSLLDPNELPTSFGEDADGELYVTTETGNVYKIMAK